LTWKCRRICPTLCSTPGHHPSSESPVARAFWITARDARGLASAQRAADARRLNQKGAIGTGDPASTAKEKHPTWPPGHWGTGKHRRPPGITSRSLSMSDAASSLPDRIEQYGHALTAGELAKLIAVSTISIYKLAKANRLPCFRVGSCVRFDPRAVADWSRKM
jgi:excisionase family DNA binding protein